MRCHCAKHWLADSRSLRGVQGTPRVWEGPRGPSRRGGRGASCAPKPRQWQSGMERARWARSEEDMKAHDAHHDRLGPDRWRSAQPQIPRSKSCPNECLGRGRCSYGFCHCSAGYWGLDCGLSRERLLALRTAHQRPRVYVYEVPAALRRSCAPWTLPEDLGDRLLLSDYLEPNPVKVRRQAQRAAGAILNFAHAHATHRLSMLPTRHQKRQTSRATEVR